MKARSFTARLIDRLLPWLAGISSVLILVGLSLCVWLVKHRDQLPDPLLPQGSTLLENYNAVAHQLWVILFVAVSAALLFAAALGFPGGDKTQRQHQHRAESLWSSGCRFLRHHPIACGLLITYSVVMVGESSWFYKEIVTWFDDIHNGLLLNNFSLHPSFVGEAMGRNDFRFFPLSHQDLHILSWLTPYPRVWALVSSAELFATIGLSVALVQQSCRSGKRQGVQATTPVLLLIACILYLFTSSSAYNYFQFIYSERLLTLLLALFGFHWFRYQQTGETRLGFLAILWALIGTFVKDSAIVLFIVPALAMLITSPPRKWVQEQRLELNLLCLAPMFIASFIWLSLLPSLYLGDQRYDANLSFSAFDLDIRTVILLLFVLVRLAQVMRKPQQIMVIDGLNVGALAYALALWILVGFKSTSYMALPVNLIAVIDVLMVWSLVIAPWLLGKTTMKNTALIGVGLSVAIVAVEHRFAQTFLGRLTTIRNIQRSWRATFDQAQTLAIETRREGKPVNLIFSKSWFKHSDYLRTLPYDRLIYLNPDTHTSKVVDGIGIGTSYIAQPGDFFLDLDSGNKLKKFKIDLTSYQLVYDYDPDVSNGHIYRRLAE